MKPGPLPDVDAIPDHIRSASSMEGRTSPSDRGGLAVIGIPMQRVITPISEEERQAGSAGASPVEYKPIKLPGPVDGKKRQNAESTIEPNRGDSTSSSTTATTTKTKSDEGVEVKVLSAADAEIRKPGDDIVVHRKNESRYRLLLRHDFHPSLVLPLWDPSPVELGAVGYLSRPSGSFITLFNSFNPSTSTNGRAKGMPSLEGYGKVIQGSQRQDRRTVAKRGLDIIQGLLWFRSRKEGVFQQSVSRRYSYPLRAGQKSSYLCTETTVYRYVENLETPKEWLAANIDRILQLYGTEHCLAKEDIYLIIGTLDTPDYALFVNHNNPDGQMHFNVFAAPREGEHWGAFSTDTDLPATAAGGPVYREDVPGRHLSANKVSIVSHKMSTVLLARLRFKSDEEQPTSL